MADGNDHTILLPQRIKQNSYYCLNPPYDTASASIPNRFSFVQRLIPILNRCMPKNKISRDHKRNWIPIKQRTLLNITSNQTDTAQYKCRYNGTCQIRTRVIATTKRTQRNVTKQKYKYCPRRFESNCNKDSD